MADFQPVPIVKDFFKKEFSWQKRNIPQLHKQH